jgi:hypothetical protein
MAQGEEPLAKPAGAEMNSVSPLIAVALSEPELRSSHPHPAGAPRFPPEPARRGIDRLDVGRPRVERSSAHAMPKTVAAKLLLLPTFCRLLRCRFLRFSLLRHCCPPSVSVDGDIGAVQSRIDPHYNPITTAGKK